MGEKLNNCQFNFILEELLSLEAVLPIVIMFCWAFVCLLGVYSY
jgi:hypothetical protein